MLNNKAIKVLEGYLKNNEDYENVKLTSEQYNFIYLKCADISLNQTEDKIWEQVECILNGILFNLGYIWSEEDYKYRIA